MRKRRADIDHAQAVDQELRQLEDAIVHRRNPLAHMRDTRRRRRNDHVIALEHAREALQQPAGLVLVARIHVHLPATRLLERKLDLATEPLQQFDHCSPYRREQRVVETGDEQGHLHRLQPTVVVQIGRCRPAVAAAFSAKRIPCTRSSLPAAAAGRTGSPGLVAAELPKAAELLDRLDPLGDRTQSEVGRQIDAELGTPAAAWSLKTSIGRGARSRARRRRSITVESSRAR